MESRGASGRRAYLAALPTSRPALNKGPKSSSSRWFSWVHSHDYWDQWWSTKLMILTFVSIRKGWARSMTDIFKESDARLLKASGTGAVEAGSSSTASGGAASGSSAPPQPAAAEQRGQKRKHDSRAKATQDGKTKLNDMRAGSSNTLHAVARLLADSNFKSLCRVIALVSKPWSLDHGENAKLLRSKEDVIRIYAGWAHRTWLEQVVSMLQCADNTVALGRCGFYTNFGRAKDPSVLVWAAALGLFVGESVRPPITR